MNSLLQILDVTVIRETECLGTSVSRKKTHTGRYLNLKYHYYESVKEGVAKSHFERDK